MQFRSIVLQKVFRGIVLYLLGLDDNWPGALTAEGYPDEGHALGEEQVVALVARQGGAGQPVTQVPSPTPVRIVWSKLKPRG
jgi:hypothetical protein